MKKILIVDDEPIMLKVMERILSDHYEIVCCSSGKELWVTGNFGSLVPAAGRKEAGNDHERSENERAGA